MKHRESVVVYKAPWRCTGKLRELAETQILCGFPFKAISKPPRASISSFVPLPPILTSFCPFRTYLHCFGHSFSISCLLFTFLSHGDISFSFSLSHTRQKTGIRAGGAAVSNLFVGSTFFKSGAWISPGCRCCYSAKPWRMRLLALDGPSYSWSSRLARRSSPNGHKSLPFAIIMVVVIRSVCLWRVIFHK